MSKTVLYISKADLVVVYPGKGKNWSTKTWTWNEKNINNILKELKAIDHHLIILLAPDISYYKKIESEQVLNRALITEQLPKFFPETLSPRQWDWKKLDEKTYLLEAVTTRVWQWIEAAEKIGIILDKITTAKYVAERDQVDLANAHELFKAVLAEARDRGADENVLDITFKQPKKSAKPAFMLILFVMIMSLSFFILYSYFNKQKLKEEERLKQAALTLITPSPTPEITEAPKPEDFNLRLRDNSGIVGYASKSASLFDGAGFSNVDIIVATNAAEKKVSKETIVHVKTALPENIKNIIDKLLPEKKPVYQIDLTDNDVVDILIILGS